MKAINVMVWALGQLLWSGSPSVWQVDKNLGAHKKCYCKASGYIYWKL